VRRALSAYPPTFDLLLRTYEREERQAAGDIIVGFVDPNARRHRRADQSEAGCGRQGRSGG